ncbi:leucine-rich repeat-containing protein 57-like [Camellia sinensis]|uniref:leucine-rich repeat-containing protein 57-like n=1 Tax=Camellia sinensis TaxID=4442 RepID=UPI0010356737|nr:leucine-rich repeat-containing protein 57-like [Camellia sinensis]
MWDETKIVLQKLFIPSLFLRQGRLGLIETPKVEKWTNLKEIELMNNKLSELPENPKCPFLQKLILHNNYDLMEIPELFFESMPLLRVLDLSYTSIKSLPPSISRLRSLQTFNLRGCALLMELPPQLGVRGNLEIFDLEGTEIMYLPEEIGELISLTCFKVSLCGCANRYMDLIIPTKALLKLSELEELSIDVNPDDEWWDAEVKTILNEPSKALKLKFLELYLPTVEILQLLRWKGTELKYPDWFEFRFIVGCHRQRLISRLPHEVEERFKKWNKWRKRLEYINGDRKPTEITEVLTRAFVFFLDRHWTIRMLSDFGNENLVKLKFCLLVECNELQTIIDGNYKYPSGVVKEPIF